MAPFNVEIKARCSDPDRVRAALAAKGAVFQGLDHQTDTYYRVPGGRLKLREGNIENALIFYRRKDVPGPKKAEILLHEPGPDGLLKDLLEEALGAWITVRKAREIHWIGNVKFHVDEVEGLGTFVEIEAIDRDGSLGEDRLRGQCAYYMKLFGVSSRDLLAQSYSDLLASTGEKGAQS
ncbi:MAG: class IV adenylate cyclase [Acidobacteriota bacterium]|jgi:adenylate cyclase, class 2